MIKTYVDFDSLLSKTASNDTIIQALREEPVTASLAHVLSKQAEADIYADADNNDKKDDIALVAGGAGGALAVKSHLSAKKAKKKFKEENAKSLGSKLKGYGTSAWDAVKPKGGAANKQLRKLKRNARNTKIGAGVAAAALAAHSMDLGRDKTAGDLVGKPEATKVSLSEKIAEDGISAGDAALVAGAGAAGAVANHHVRSKLMAKKGMNAASKVGAGVGAAAGSVAGMPLGLATGAVGGVAGSHAGESLMRRHNKKRIAKAATGNRTLGAVIGAGTALSALAIKKNKKAGAEDGTPDVDENERMVDKSASPTQSEQEEAQKEVMEESTPKGAAKKYGLQGAVLGGTAGFIHGASKKSPIKGGRILRGAWNGTAGAVWGAAAGGAPAFVKKTVAPDNDNDKQKAYDAKLEKLSHDINSVGHIAPLNLAVVTAGQV